MAGRRGGEGRGGAEPESDGGDLEHDASQLGERMVLADGLQVDGKLYKFNVIV